MLATNWVKDKELGKYIDMMFEGHELSAESWKNCIGVLMDNLTIYPFDIDSKLSLAFNLYQHATTISVSYKTDVKNVLSLIEWATFRLIDQLQKDKEKEIGGEDFSVILSPLGTKD